MSNGVTVLAAVFFFTCLVGVPVSLTGYGWVVFTMGWLVSAGVLLAQMWHAVRKPNRPIDIPAETPSVLHDHQSDQETFVIGE